MPLVRTKPPKPKPLFPCPACGSREFWWRQAILFDVPQVGEWLCSRCHPDPREPQPITAAPRFAVQADCSNCEYLPKCEGDPQMPDYFPICEKGWSKPYKCILKEASPTQQKDCSECEENCGQCALLLRLQLRYEEGGDLCQDAGE